MDTEVFSDSRKKNCSPTSSSSVDIDRYTGPWYDISSFAVQFQRDFHFSAAEYAMTSESCIKVANKCHKGGFGERESSVTGNAFVVEGSDNAEVKVQYFRPLKADYRIVRLDKAFNWAVVSSPGKEYLWLSCRKPLISEHLFDLIVDSLKNEGYETNRLKRTPQPCE